MKTERGRHEGLPLRDGGDGAGWSETSPYRGLSQVGGRRESGAQARRPCYRN
jgi:hypothetical protein